MTAPSTKNSPTQAHLPHVCIYRSELQVLAGLSLDWGHLEVGGELYGLNTHGGRPVIFLVTGPGRGATHQHTHFRQDIDFFRSVHARLGGVYPIQLLGTWHSHHILGLQHPSHGDIQQVQSLTAKNNLTRWHELIVTHNGVHQDAEAPPRNRDSAQAALEARARVDAFCYVDPQASAPEGCRVRIVPGVSPFRLAALSESIVEPWEIGGETRTQCPLERIDLDLFPLQRAERSHEPGIPAVLQKQCEEMPTELQHGIELELEPHRIVVTVTLRAHRTVRVTYSQVPPHRIERVEYGASRSGRYHDMIRWMPSDLADLSLADVCAALLAKRTQKSLHKADHRTGRAPAKERATNVLCATYRC